MFVIGATKKLQDEIKQPIEKDVETFASVPEIYQWHANIVTVNRRKCLILMNNRTGLNLTLFGLRKQQFEHLDSVIKGSLKQLLVMLEVDTKIINQMLQEAEEIVYTKTKSRQVLGMMNDLKFSIEAYVEGMSYEDIDAVEINQQNNSIPYQALEHYFPKETFIKYFEEK